MPEITGVVTAKSEKGIMVDQLGERWAIWSNIEYRGEPFNTNVKKGDVVCITYAEKEWPDGKKTIFISVIDRVTQAQDVTLPDVGSDRQAAWEASGNFGPPPDDWQPVIAQTPPAPAYGPVSGKDALMAKMNAIKATSELYAACIEAGLYKKLPTPDEISSYAEAIEARLE